MKHLLIKSNNETQLLIKSEAEKNLSDLHKSEDLITNKINNFLKFSFTVLIVLIGYAVKLSEEENIGYGFFITMLLAISFSLIIFILFKSIFPKNSRLLGSEPDKLVQPDIINLDKFDVNRIIVNRILCIQDAINVAKSSYRSRLNSYKNANLLLLISIGFSILTFLVSLLYQA